MEMIADYGALSGYKININKTQVFSGVPPNRIKSLYRWNWEADSIKYLGVFQTKDFSKTFDANYGPLTSRL